MIRQSEVIIVIFILAIHNDGHIDIQQIAKLLRQLSRNANNNEQKIFRYSAFVWLLTSKSISRLHCNSFRRLEISECGFVSYMFMYNIVETQSLILLRSLMSLTKLPVTTGTRKEKKMQNVYNLRSCGCQKSRMLNYLFTSVSTHWFKHVLQIRIDELRGAYLLRTYLFNTHSHSNISHTCACARALIRRMMDW